MAYCSSGCALKTSTGTLEAVARISFNTSKPLRPCIETSSSTSSQGFFQT